MCLSLQQVGFDYLKHYSSPEVGHVLLAKCYGSITGEVLGKLASKHTTVRSIHLLRDVLRGIHKEQSAKWQRGVETKSCWFKSWQASIMIYSKHLAENGITHTNSANLIIKIKPNAASPLIEDQFSSYHQAVSKQNI